MEQSNNTLLTPIKIVRTLDNCYSGSRPVLDSITESYICTVKSF